MNESTDWSRVKYGGPNDVQESGHKFGNSGKSNRFDGVDMYATANTLAYPSLIYEPSKPVVRYIKSDTDRVYEERSRKRKARYDKKTKNLNVTLTRIEFETLEAECREKRRVQRRAQDMIRYDSVNLMGGLVGFKKQPSQMVGRKQNLDMLTKMFVGQVTLGNTEKGAPDSRDFSTTYTSQYTTV